MKLTNNGKDYIIYLHKKLITIDSYLKEDIEKYIKKLIVDIKKMYKIKLSGSYIVNIYQNDDYGLIIEILKKRELDFFPDLIDLKLNIFYKSEIFLEFNDYFIISKYKNIYYHDNKYYLNIKEITKYDKIKFSEFSSFIYGNNLNSLQKHLLLLKSKNYS